MYWSLVARLSPRGLGKKVIKRDKRGGGSFKRVTSLIPKISYSRVPNKRSVRYIFSCCHCFTAPVSDEIISIISDQIIARERLFLIDFRDQSQDKRWHSVTRGGPNSYLSAHFLPLYFDIEINVSNIRLMAVFKVK